MNTIVLALAMGIFAGLGVIYLTLSTNVAGPLLFGFIAGIIVGDPQVGLQVGATCSLMALGFHTYGGATIPNYQIGALFGVFIAKQSGDVQQGIVIGSIVALLMTWFDILGRGTTTVFQHGGDRALARRDLKSFEKWHIAGVIPWFLGRFIPVFIGFLFIDRYEIIQNFINTYDWIRKGLSVVGAALPAVGFALLLSYMDIKKYWPYMLGGYVLFAFMRVPTLGLAIVGIAAAGLYMQQQKEKVALQAEIIAAAAAQGEGDKQNG
jgi:PTS system mannose-specific IIC component